MNKKAHNLKHINYLNNFDIIANTLLEWQKKKRTDVVNDLMGTLIDINYYVTEIYTNELYFNHTVNEYRADKLRAIQRAMNAEKKIKELKPDFLITTEKDLLKLKNLNKNIIEILYALPVQLSLSKKGVDKILNKLELN